MLAAPQRRSLARPGGFIARPGGFIARPGGFIATPRLRPTLSECGRMRPALAAWLVLSLLGGMGAQDMCGDPPATPSHSVPAPQLSPEERLSPHMPQALRCDACHAIAFQVGTGDAAPQKRSENSCGDASAWGGAAGSLGTPH